MKTAVVDLALLRTTKTRTGPTFARVLGIEVEIMRLPKTGTLSGLEGIRGLGKISKRILKSSKKGKEKRRKVN